MGINSSFVFWPHGRSLLRPPHAFSRTISVAVRHGLLLLIGFLSGCGGCGETFPEPPVPVAVGTAVPEQCSEANLKDGVGMPGAVYYGTRDPTHVPLSAEQILAVVALSQNPNGGSNCSGTLISEDVVLTAKHCTQGWNASNIFVLFGQDDDNPVLAIQTEQKRQHQNRDLALLRLTEKPADSIDVEPIPIVLNNLSSLDIGITAEQAGYGRTETGYSDGRFFVAEELYGFENGDQNLVVNGYGEKGVCFGDSGGPSMRIGTAGETRVMGALSWGDGSCVDLDRYSRVDVVRSWVEEWAGPTPEAGPQPCEDVTTVGSCAPDGSEATYCSSADELMIEECDDDEICDYSADADGYRCILQTDAPCGGETYFGRCDGETLVWCDEGRVRERPCDACDERCGLVDSQRGYDCMLNGCGDVDYLGRCTEDGVAEWCSNGELRRRDCASQDLACGFVNDEVGYFCYRETACGSIDYQGHCLEGEIAQWCNSDGELESINCADRGQVCRWVNNNIGYYCADP